jgi:hypothetical protein
MVAKVVRVRALRGGYVHDAGLTEQPIPLHVVERCVALGHELRIGREQRRAGRLGFGRIVVSETQVPNMLAIPV